MHSEQTPAKSDTTPDDSNHIQRKKWTNMSNQDKLAFLKWSKYSTKCDSNNSDAVFDQNGQQLSKKGLQRAIRRWVAAKNRPVLKKAKKISKLSKEKESDTKQETKQSDTNEYERKQGRTVYLKGKEFRQFVNVKLNLMQCPKIVIDCQFDKYMNNDEVIALSNQIYQLYGTNNRALKPFNIFLTSFNQNSRLWNQFFKNNNAKEMIEKLNINFVQDSINDMIMMMNETQTVTTIANGGEKSENREARSRKYVTIGDVLANTDENETQKNVEKQQRESNLNDNDNDDDNDGEMKKSDALLSHTAIEIFCHDDIVYLTSESENELKTIEKDKVYVIGGWVDHNRYKGGVHQLAKQNGWKTAKLPILKYMHFVQENVKKDTRRPSRNVITVNQVFDILLGLWNWDQNWNKALLFGLPKRKGLTLIDKEQLKSIDTSALKMNDTVVFVPSNVKHDTFKETLAYIVHQRIQSK